LRALLATQSYKNIETAAIIMAAVCVCSIHLSPAIASISLVLAGLLAIYAALAQGKSWLNIGLWLLAMVAWQACTEWLVIGHISQEAGRKLLVKLPLISIPFLLIMSISRSRFEKIVFFISLAFTWIGLASVLHYLEHKAFYDVMIAESKPLPIYTLVYHIEFSLLLCLSSLTALYTGFSGRKHFWGQAIILLGVLQILCLHILSARTGLLAFYVGLIPMIFMAGKGLRIRQWIGIVGIAIISILAASQIPSLNQRIKNSAEDLSTVVNEGDVNNKSFGQRWMAWKASIRCIKKEPILGYGLSNVKTTIDDHYSKQDLKRIKPENHVMPHNVYLEQAVQSGILTSILFIIFLAQGIWVAHRRQQYMLMGVIFAIAAASCFESITERQAGVAAIIVFISLAAAVKTVEQKDK
jgi:O-antigen ligase